MNKPFAIPTSQGGSQKSFYSGNFRRVIFILIFLSNALLSLAQVPQQFSFQGVARNSEGKFITNKSIALRMTIRFEKPEGKSFYQETHQVTTTAGGVFTVSIGGGTKVSGDFSGIDWKSASHFLHVEMDAEGGGNFVDLGTTQMLSVPYAQYANAATKWQDGLPVVQRYKLGAELDDIDPNDPNAPNDPDFPKYNLPDIGIGPTMIWYPKDGAFRAGDSQNDSWEKNNIGSYSVAFGGNTVASGTFSTALGYGSRASTLGAVAMGLNSQANGVASTAIGDKAIAYGPGSVSIGVGTYARTRNSIVVGMYNSNSGNPDDDKPLPTDQIFQIGNGSSIDSKSNAMTVLRNGFTGIGNKASDAQFMLDVGGRARIHHNGETAGIYFNNSTNLPSGFVGMLNDNKIGLYVGGKWNLRVGDNGSTAGGNNTVADAAKSTAFGGNTEANSAGATAFGDHSKAHGVAATATGYYATAFGVASFATGSSSEAGGDVSAAFGEGTFTKAFGSTVFGAYNNVQDNVDGGSKALSDSKDRIFQIGNGLNSQSRSNVLTILRNGNVGIGKTALNPNYLLDLGSAMRIRHNGVGNGMYLDNSTNQPLGFVGMRDDDRIGVYNNGLYLELFKGNAYVSGVYHEHSDRRLKRDFSRLSNSLEKITSLNGYNYFWINTGKDQSLQTGLIAQEVEVLFPELVKADKEGIKSLNYDGLIPHLIESIKDLKAEIEMLKKGK